MEEPKAIDDGGPAFPASISFGQPIHQTGPQSGETPGMTLRDYFAAQSLLQVLDVHAALENRTPEKVAAAAYAVADAMLKARVAK